MPLVQDDEVRERLAPGPNPLHHRDDKVDWPRAMGVCIPLRLPSQQDDEVRERLAPGQAVDLRPPLHDHVRPRGLRPAHRSGDISPRSGRACVQSSYMGLYTELYPYCPTLLQPTSGYWPQ